ncbi:MAG: hypothetical protein Fur0039_13220 [Rhodocyclaceae bacterium]
MEGQFELSGHRQFHGRMVSETGRKPKPKRLAGQRIRRLCARAAVAGAASAANALCARVPFAPEGARTGARLGSSPLGQASRRLRVADSRIATITAGMKSETPLRFRFAQPAKLRATKSQFTRFQNASTYFGRALR